MKLADLLREPLDEGNQDVRENERTPTPVRRFGVRLHKAQGDPPTAEPSRVAVDGEQIEGDGEKKWLYAAVDTESSTRRQNAS